LDSQPTVLIVDRSDETLEVLQTALERRGLRTFAATAADRGLALARQHCPDLIVLDLEMDASSPETLSAPFAAHAQAGHTPLVMLGTARRDTQRLPEGEFVAKPYHYGPLIRKIEELLTRDERREARGGG
jgi:two-component system, response regulator RegA